MAKQTTDPREIYAVRKRYYDALHEGMTKEDAAWWAMHGGDKPKVIAKKPVAAPTPAKVTAAPPAPPPEPEIKKAVKKDDDLTKIRGVSATTAKRLRELGVTRFVQVAQWNKDDVTRFDRRLALKGRIGKEDWVGQAKELVE